jgi:hypothetical protein
MCLARWTHTRASATIAAVLVAVFLLAVVACVGASVSMTRHGAIACVSSDHGSAANLVSPAATTPSVVAGRFPLTPAFMSFASRAPRRTDIASIGAPPDDPLHGLLLI